MILLRTAGYKLALKLLVLLLIAVPVLHSRPAHAADLTNRRIHIRNPVTSAVTQHQVSFNYVTAASVGSIEVEYCANSPLVGTACTPPSGFDVSAATLSAQSGVVGYSIHANTTANRLVLSRTPGTITPQPASYLLSSVTNASTTGTHFARLATFASTDGTGTRIDEGGIALSLNDPLTISTFVPPILLFCIGTAIPTNNCSSATGDTIDFGELSRDATSHGTTQMLAATNGYGGYSITVTGTTMTSGNNVIPALSTPTAAQVGVSQFGINLRANATPPVGANPSGNGTASPRPRYNVANGFTFANGDVVAASTTSTDINRFTTSYMVNVGNGQAPGVYSTTLTYIALASF